MGNLKARISRLWAAAAARADTGRLKLTGDEAVTLFVEDVDAIAEARAAGKVVFVCDEKPPENVIN